MGVSRFTLLPLLLTVSSFLLHLSAAEMTGSFKCGGGRSATCSSLVGFAPQNATTLGDLQALFSARDLQSILAANDLPLSTPRNQRWSANQTIRIPIPCSCSNGTGISNRVPTYTVKVGDTLSGISSVVFRGLVQFQSIGDVNGIKDVDVIEVGQRLWIPLPCSCDKVDGEDVVHYAHVVEPGSSVEKIAAQFGTDNATLLRLNGISGDSELLANYAFDVPLRVCSSSVRNDSLDSPMLVVNGSYTITANNCVKCSCNASRNWTLSCEPSQLKPANWQTCPSMQCQGQKSLLIGNTTSSSCGPRSCAYAGFSNQTIFTTLSPDSCPGSRSGNHGSRFHSDWKFSVVSVQLVLLCLHLLW
ncbi:PREDICTED: lysM domain-containing GPI-anchored protein 2 [Tarenaya hassleriana]|uniref:lysM domain-containing GPI-anchored protein 2 n=1 Tax=Tarenaya hassleriana TaxID=28532 RepID=UPI00053C9CD7|nr:PREDICTED: lysM domain-containing GPI-anchored protein 2 [Tarenaya hassleriana]